MCLPVFWWLWGDGHEKLEGQSWKVEDIERVKEGYWEKLLITAISMIICVGPEKSIIPDISLLWLF